MFRKIVIDMFIDEEFNKLQKNYEELLYAVTRKFPGETRHQTALRYIKEMEEYNSAVDTCTKEVKCLIN